MIPVVSEHHCTRHHRNAATLLRCADPGVEVVGSGRLAVRCSATPRVFLVERLRPARILRQELNLFRCGPGCARDHELVAIDIDGTSLRAQTRQEIR